MKYFFIVYVIQWIAKDTNTYQQLIKNGLVVIESGHWDENPLNVVEVEKQLYMNIAHDSEYYYPFVTITSFQEVDERFYEANIKLRIL